MPLHRPWTPPSTPWHVAREHKRRFLFWRFARLMAGMFLVFLIGLLILIWVFYKPLSQALGNPWLLLLVLCGVPFVFFGLAGALGGWGLRRMGAPLVDVMSAADAVAEGDLSVRVREDVPGEFGRLARSFNRMTAELARAEQQRRNLTADVAHELRTPLHIIQGNLEGVLDGVYQPTPEHIAATLEETRLLARLVDDLRTLSLAEAGQLALHFEPLDVNDLLEDALTRFSGQAAAQHVELALAVTGDNLSVRADHDRLDQVITNLVANALEHTPSGGSIRLEAHAAGNGVEIVVRDTGEGIPAEDLPFVFDRFWRADPARTRKAGGGSGLGLSIARQIVQAHGGKISVESQPGRGSVFTLSLPAAGAEAPGPI